jgi:hypothetical protein
VRRDDGGCSWPKCPGCGKDTVCIGKHWRVPKLIDVKTWKELEEKIEEIIRCRKLSPPYKINL